MKRILIIEDEELVREVLKKRLSKEGYEVFLAEKGEEGLEKIKKILPDLIILDLVMPKTKGFEIMKEVKRRKKLKEIPIIVISNSGKKSELELAKEKGAVDWIIKTEFDIQNILKKIKKQRVNFTQYNLQMQEEKIFRVLNKNPLLLSGKYSRKNDTCN